MNAVAVVMGQQMAPGAGYPAEPDALGLDDWFDERNIPAIILAHDDPQLPQKLAGQQFAGAIGHSFGGYELLQNIRLMKPLDWAMFLDPKPKGFEWANLLYEFPLPVPQPAILQCFYNWFGRPFKGLHFSMRLPDCDHGNFPKDQRVLGWLDKTLAEQGLIASGEQLHVDENA